MLAVKDRGMDEARLTRVCQGVLFHVVACVCGVAFGGISLDGAWSLSYRLQQEGGEWKSVSATVPGDALVDLERAGDIPDPMVGTNVWGLFRYE